MVNRILYKKRLFEQNTNNGQQNTIQKRLFEQKHKQWSTKYYTKNDYLSKTQTVVNKILYKKRLFEQNTNNGQQNTIQKTTI
jgi:hypothetical protein